MAFYDQFKKLCREYGRAEGNIADELGISRGSITQWKNGTHPKNETMKKIADRFGVTVDWLLSDDPLPGTFAGKDRSEEYMPLSAHEKLLLDLWESIDEEGQGRLLAAFMRQYNIEMCRMRGITLPEDSQL